MGTHLANKSLAPSQIAASVKSIHAAVTKFNDAIKQAKNKTTALTLIFKNGLQLVHNGKIIVDTMQNKEVMVSRASRGDPQYFARFFHELDMYEQNYFEDCAGNKDGDPFPVLSIDPVIQSLNLKKNFCDVTLPGKLNKFFNKQHHPNDQSNKRQRTEGGGEPKSISSNELLE